MHGPRPIPLNKDLSQAPGIGPAGLQAILSGIHAEITAHPPAGHIPTYIPELGKVPVEKFGIHLSTLEGRDIHVGDHLETFSAQSISKVFSLSMAFALEGVRLWERMGVEASEGPFNSVARIEQLNGIPRNPFINAGALVMADVLVSHLADPEGQFLAFVNALCGTSGIVTDPNVARSEASVGHMNAALINLMKHHGNIHNPIGRVLDFYYFQCSLAMSCAQLAHTFLPFADHGRPFLFNGFALTRSQVKRINALMMTCGFYDESGDFSYRVGLPGKSGVGGGIVAIHPGEYAVAVWSPGLNTKGNSLRGMQALELLTTRTNRSIF